MAEQADVSAVCLDEAITPCPLPPEVLAMGFGEPESDPDQPPLDLITPDDRELVLSAVLRARSNGWAETAARYCDGDERVNIHVVNMTVEWGAIVIVAGGSHRPLVTDITASATPRLPRRLVHLRDRTGHIISADAATELLLGWTPAELVGVSALELVDPADHERAIQAWVDMLAGLPADHIRVRYLTASGDRRWMEARPTNQLDDPAAGYVEVELIDVHDEMLALTAARSGEAQFEALTESLPVGVVQVDRVGTVVYRNRWMRDFTIRADGTSPWEAAIISDDRHRVENAFMRTILGSGASTVDAVLIRGLDGQPRNCRLRIRSLGIDDDGVARGAIASIEDVTETLEVQARLRGQVRADHLTGLPNRLALNEWLQAHLAPGVPYPGVTVLYLDLDGFKNVNDQFGHAAGDLLLTEIAAVAGRTIGDGDLLARVGGDEFVIARAGYASPAASASLANDLLHALDRPFSVGGATVRLSCSVGIARCAEPYESSLVLALADVAMYRAKRAGGGRWRMHDGGSHERDATTAMSSSGATTEPDRLAR